VGSEARPVPSSFVNRRRRVKVATGAHALDTMPCGEKGGVSGLEDSPEGIMKWLSWAQRIQSIAQTGLAYAADPYDLERYQQLRTLAVEMAAHHLSEPAETIAPVFAAEGGYPTPKVDIRAVVFDRDEVLLVRERAAGLWAIPGGWADVGESPGEVASRETLEEAGYVVRPVKVLAVFDKAKHGHPPSLDYVYKVFIGCDLLGGEPRTSHETDAVGFFGIQALPQLDERRVTLGQVQRMFEHLKNPSLPTDFD
jgi:ADP-ribose pyrophosphatase YjhB (NUDIX family)